MVPSLWICVVFARIANLESSGTVLDVDIWEMCVSRNRIYMF